MLPHAVPIREVIAENPRLKTFVLDTAIAGCPGQYVMVWLPGVDEKPLALVHADPLTILVARAGSFGEAVHQRRQGHPLHFRGPYGQAFPLVGKHILLVGGGYGVAPLYFLAWEAVQRGLQVAVILGARTATDLLYEARFAALGVQLHITTDDGSQGLRAYATHAAQRLLARQRIDAVYGCGPEPMLRRLGETAEKHRVPCYLATERHLKCGGLGLCGSCELNGSLVCTEGPVFPYATLKALPDFGKGRRDASARKTYEGSKGG